MRDPHVVALYYRVVTDRDSFEFAETASAVDHEESAFRVHLEGNIARVEMKDHHATVESARAVVELFLEAWEVGAALDCGRREWSFRFDRPEIVDRNPPGPGEPIEVSAVVNAKCDVSMRAKFTSALYPKPPIGFQASDDVLRLMRRYERSMAGGEPLTGMAQYCLTFIEEQGFAAAKAHRWGKITKHEAAGRLYCVDPKVFGKIGQLCSDHGDVDTARKYRPNEVPLMPVEREWIEHAVRTLIRRVGEHDFDPMATLPTITMADLPPL